MVRVKSQGQKQTQMKKCFNNCPVAMNKQPLHVAVMCGGDEHFSAPTLTLLNAEAPSAVLPKRAAQCKAVMPSCFQVFVLKRFRI